MVKMSLKSEKTTLLLNTGSLPNAGLASCEFYYLTTTRLRNRINLVLLASWRMLSRDPNLQKFDRKQFRRKADDKKTEKDLNQQT